MLGQALGRSVDYEIGADEPPSTAVIRAVSAVEGEDPTSLPPLGTVVDTDAVDDLFTSRFDGAARAGGRLSFVYCGYRITIDNGEYLTLVSVDGRSP